MSSLEALASMKYSGRGIIVGITPEGDAVVGYSLTGRSASSQARELVESQKTHTIRTSVTDEEQLKTGSRALLIYPAIAPVYIDPEELLGVAVSNGAQTGLIYSAIQRRGIPVNILNEAFKENVEIYDEQEDRWIDITTFEPDAPNNTPRISAYVEYVKREVAALVPTSAAIHIVRCEDGEEKKAYFDFDLEPGKGKLITTYKGGNEIPLMPFTGDPLEVEVEVCSAQEFAEQIYAAIGPKDGANYRVAAAVAIVKPTGLETAIINRSQRGE